MLHSVNASLVTETPEIPKQAVGLLQDFWGLSYERSINTVQHNHLAVVVGYVHPGGPNPVSDTPRGPNSVFKTPGASKLPPN